MLCESYACKVAVKLASVFELIINPALRMGALKLIVRDDGPTTPTRASPSIGVDCGELGAPKLP